MRNNAAAKRRFMQQRLWNVQAFTSHFFQVKRCTKTLSALAPKE